MTVTFTPKTALAETREAVARIVDPFAFTALERSYIVPVPEEFTRMKVAREKADAILALLPQNSDVHTEDDIKLTYIKRWRTIVKLPAKYADEIAEALREPDPAQPISQREIQTLQERTKLQAEMIERRDGELAIARASQPSVRKFAICGDCGLDEHCGERCPNFAPSLPSAECHTQQKFTQCEQCWQPATCKRHGCSCLSRPSAERGRE